LYSGASRTWLRVSSSVIAPGLPTARRLAEAGCTAHEIAAITGHASLAELVSYTRAVDQRRLAEAAMAKSRTSSVKPAVKFDKKAEKSLRVKGSMTE
jgi:hypothetical protein